MKNNIKLDTCTRRVIIMNVFIAILNISIGIINKNIDDYIIGLLFITIAISEYCFSKIIAIKDRDLKRKDEIINILSKNNSNNKGDKI